VTFSIGLRIYGAALATLLLLDLAWLGLVARAFYQRELAPLLRPDVQWAPAVLFYLVFVGGVLLFAIAPALASGSLGRAVLLGACLGALAYATYDLTSLALIRGFPLRVAIIDILWGASLTAAVAAAGFLAGRAATG